MRAGRFGAMLAMGAALVLSACGNGGEPRLMNLRSASPGPDEFAIVPPKPLEMPPSLTELPMPTPGGENRTDPRPLDDAAVALGGRAGGGGGADGAFIAHVGRYGRDGAIREALAAEDLEFRRKNRGRPLERLFGLSVYHRAYRKTSLDPQDELARWRRAGVYTPSAPPKGRR